MKVKDHDSDEEPSEQPVSQFQKDKDDLEGAPTIPAHEISPAAFIFNPTEEEQQQILFQEKP